MLRPTLAAAAFVGTALLLHGGVAADKAPPDSVHQFKVKTIDEKNFDLRELQGRVLLFVNVASK